MCTGLHRHQAAAVGLVWAVLVLACGGSWAEESSPPCTGNSVTVQRGDTLSRLADRCDVSESSILAANPDVNGSMDLQVGETIRLSRQSAPDRGRGWTLKNFVNDAHDALGRVADTVGASVQDLLNKNPDLRARLDNLGRKVGLPGGETSPTMAVTPSSGAPGLTVTVSGVGWPKDSSVTIGAGASGSAHEKLQTTRTSSNGTFDAHLQVPSWAAPDDRLVFTAKSGRNARARSERFRVTQ